MVNPNAINHHQSSSPIWPEMGGVRDFNHFQPSEITCNEHVEVYHIGSTPHFLTWPHCADLANPLPRRGWAFPTGLSLNEVVPCRAGLGQGWDVAWCGGNFWGSNNDNHQKDGNVIFHNFNRILQFFWGGCDAASKVQGYSRTDLPQIPAS